VSGALSRHRRPSAFAALALAAPACAFVGVMLVYPLARFMLAGLQEGGLALYAGTLTDPVYVGVFLQTFAIGAACTVISVGLAYPVAYFLATTSRTWALLGFFMVLLPFWTSIVVRTYAWMVLLGRNGPVNQAIVSLGIADEPQQLMFNHFGNLVGMVHWLLPFAIFPIYSVMLRLDRRLLLAAKGLGASGMRTFLHVFLPLTMPGVFAGGAIVFVLSIAAFVTPALLGGGKVVMMAQLIEQQVRQFLDWPLAAVLSFMLAASALVLYASANRFTKATRHVV
jgi:ABC-type spermidine/putrescine transport system permease subunit I